MKALRLALALLPVLAADAAALSVPGGESAPFRVGTANYKLTRVS